MFLLYELIGLIIILSFSDNVWEKKTEIGKKAAFELLTFTDLKTQNSVGTYKFLKNSDFLEYESVVKTETGTT